MIAEILTLSASAAAITPGVVRVVLAWKAASESDKYEIRFVGREGEASIETVVLDLNDEASFHKAASFMASHHSTREELPDGNGVDGQSDKPSEKEST